MLWACGAQNRMVNTIGYLVGDSNIPRGCMLEMNSKFLLSIIINEAYETSKDEI